MVAWRCFIVFSLFLSFHIGISRCKTFVFDELDNFTSVVHVGDSLIIKQGHIYIFYNEKAFNRCNFTQAALLERHNSSSLMWRASRPGWFYFYFNTKKKKDTPTDCKAGKKRILRVIQKQPVYLASPPLRPPVTSGGHSSFPPYPSPLSPTDPATNTLENAPSNKVPGTIPSIFPDPGNVMPFISSNPAVPLPTGEPGTVIRPLPLSGQSRQVVGSINGNLVALLCMVLLDFLEFFV